MAATIDTALRAARERLASTSDTPYLDARLLLQHELAADTAWLIAHAAQPLDNATVARYDAVLARRAAGEPIAYIIGRAGFWSLELSVDSRVLVPRADTEALVEATLARLPAGAVTLADLGTGSGAIALALARERPRWRIWATDSDEAALTCARANAARLGLAGLHFLSGDWLAPLAGQRFDAIVSNPPYVAAGDAHLAALGFEPSAALVAGDDGLADLRRIAAHAPGYLNPGGWLLLEHGVDQAASVRGLLESAGFQFIETVRDLGDRPRVTLGRTGFDRNNRSVHA